MTWKSSLFFQTMLFMRDFTHALGRIQTPGRTVGMNHDSERKMLGSIAGVKDVSPEKDSLVKSFY